jgi:hypothetical protein
MLTLNNGTTKKSTDVVVVFIIRCAGCGSCREHALQLTELSKQEDSTCVCAVKEIAPKKVVKKAKQAQHLPSIPNLQDSSSSHSSNRNNDGGTIINDDDREALLDLYQNYFRFPIYKDEKWQSKDSGLAVSVVPSIVIVRV